MENIIYRMMTKTLHIIRNFKNNHQVIFGLIIFIIVFFVLNKISKNFLEQTKLEKRQIPEYLEKIYGKENVTDYQTVMKEQTLSFEYKEFVEFSEKQRSGKFTIVNSLGDRCNYNDKQKCKETKGGKKEIWVFGGSTTFGYGVKNNETITAYLENLLGNKFKVKNFGTGHYYSTQERILLNNLLTKLDDPYAVVFIDGLNDFFKKYNYNETAFTKLIKYKMSKSSTDDFKDYLKERFLRLNIVRLINEKFFKKIKTINPNNKKDFNIKDINAMVNILLANQKILRGVSEIYKFKVVHVLQPVPFNKESYSSSNLPEEYTKNFNEVRHNKLKIAYDIYLSKNDSPILDLSNLKIAEAMYIDGVHYTPQFNYEIARNILVELQ